MEELLREQVFNAIVSFLQRERLPASANLLRFEACQVTAPSTDKLTGSRSGGVAAAVAGSRSLPSQDEGGGGTALEGVSGRSTLRFAAGTANSPEPLELDPFLVGSAVLYGVEEALALELSAERLLQALDEASAVRKRRRRFFTSEVSTSTAAVDHARDEHMRPACCAVHAALARAPGSLGSAREAALESRGSLLAANLQVAEATSSDEVRYEVGSGACASPETGRVHADPAQPHQERTSQRGCTGRLENDGRRGKPQMAVPASNLHSNSEDRRSTFRVSETCQLGEAPCEPAGATASLRQLAERRQSFTRERPDCGWMHETSPRCVCSNADGAQSSETPQSAVNEAHHAAVESVAVTTRAAHASPRATSDTTVAAAAVVDHPVAAVRLQQNESIAAEAARRPPNATTTSTSTIPATLTTQDNESNAGKAIGDASVAQTRLWPGPGTLHFMRHSDMSSTSSAEAAPTEPPPGRLRASPCSDARATASTLQAPVVPPDNTRRGRDTPAIVTPPARNGPGTRPSPVTPVLQGATTSRERAGSSALADDQQSETRTRPELPATRFETGFSMDKLRKLQDLDIDAFLTNKVYARQRNDRSRVS
jgi:hypothetical protein